MKPAPSPPRLPLLLPRLAATTCAAALAAVAATAFAADPAPSGHERWEADVAALEAREAAPGGIVFVGSSSVRLWDLAGSWPGSDMVNRGFGGSLLSDTVHFFDRLVTPLRPRAVVVYAGDNDFSRGRTTAEVVATFEALAAKRLASLPDTPLVFVAVKPSVKRWALWPEMKAANEAIAALCAKEGMLHFADIAAPMLEGAAGAPDAAWFQADGLHLSPMGYERWTAVVSAVLREAGALE
jgi:lysophospholipase L1-like esterase